MCAVDLRKLIVPGCAQTPINNQRQMLSFKGQFSTASIPEFLWALFRLQASQQAHTDKQIRENAQLRMHSLPRSEPSTALNRQLLSNTVWNCVSYKCAALTNSVWPTFIAQGNFFMWTCPKLSGNEFMISTTTIFLILWSLLRNHSLQILQTT